MKLVRYRTRETSEERLGLTMEDDVLDILHLSRHLDTSIPHTMDDLLANTTDSLKQINETLEKAERTNLDLSDYLTPSSKLTYLPLIKAPEKILCVGMNYVEHIKATGGEVPISPVFFSKFSNALAGHKQEIPLQNNAQQVDYEAELVIVIGEEITNVCEKNAEKYILGYTIGNDLSDRAFQFQSSQWLIGKTMDHFAPIGPTLVTKDEIGSIQNLSIETWHNGEQVQNSSTSDMLFTVNKIVSQASQYMTLKAGDVIFTGTPRGVILERPEDQQNWLKAGDKVDITIESLGTLSSTFI